MTLESEGVRAHAEQIVRREDALLLGHGRQHQQACICICRMNGRIGMEAGRVMEFRWGQRRSFRALPMVHHRPRLTQRVRSVVRSAIQQPLG